MTLPYVDLSLWDLLINSFPSAMSFLLSYRRSQRLQCPQHINSFLYTRGESQALNVDALTSIYHWHPLSCKSFILLSRLIVGRHLYPEANSIRPFSHGHRIQLTVLLIATAAAKSSMSHASFSISPVISISRMPRHSVSANTILASQVWEADMVSVAEGGWGGDEGRDWEGVGVGKCDF